MKKATMAGEPVFTLIEHGDNCYLLTSRLQLIQLTEQQEIRFVKRLKDDARGVSCEEVPALWKMLCSHSSCEQLKAPNILDKGYSRLYFDSDGTGLGYLDELMKMGFCKEFMKHSAFELLLIFRIRRREVLRDLFTFVDELVREAMGAGVASNVQYQVEDLETAHYLSDEESKRKNKPFIRLMVEAGTCVPSVADLNCTRLGFTITSPSLDTDPLLKTARSMRQAWTNDVPIAIGVRFPHHVVKQHPEQLARNATRLLFNEGLYLEDCWLSRLLAILPSERRVRRARPCGGGLRLLALTSSGRLATCRTAIENGGTSPAPQDLEEWRKFLESPHEHPLIRQISNKMKSCQRQCALWSFCAGCSWMNCEVANNAVQMHVTMGLDAWKDLSRE